MIHNMNIKINSKFHALIPPLSKEELNQLEQNLLREGWRPNEAIVLWNDTIVDGHNRYNLCQKHKIKFKVTNKRFVNEPEAMLWIIDNQLGRRNLPNFVKLELGWKKTSLLKPIAEAKQKEEGKRLGGKPALSQKSDKGSIDVKKEAAKISGLSHDTASRVKIILDHEKEHKDLVKKLREGQKEVSINSVYNEITRKEKEAKREKQRQEDYKKVKQLQTKQNKKLEDFGPRFSTIVIDPPWDWSDEGDINQLGRAKPDYSTMTIGQLMKMPIDKISAPNSHLYLWITNRSLPKGFQLMEKWGFRYITCLTWCKPSIGMGNYFRGSTEHVLFAVKGSLPLKRKNIGTWFTAKRGKKHSEKPDEFYNIIETCSPRPRIDIFSRKNRKNWITWGTENQLDTASANGSK